jgi:hypothetical protein
MANRKLIETYWEAFKNGDLETYEACLDPQVVVSYPQSGEVFRGRDNYMETIRNYPVDLPSGSADVGLDSTATEVLKQPSVLPFGMSTPIVVTDGDLLVGRVVRTYPNGDVYHVRSIFKIRRGLIAEETTYFAAPFDAPEWRRQWSSTE